MFAVGSRCLTNLCGTAGTGRLQNGIHAVLGVAGRSVGGLQTGGKNNVAGWCCKLYINLSSSSEINKAGLQPLNNSSWIFALGRGL